MRESANELMVKGLAVLVLVFVAYLLFKVVLGIVTTVVWIAVVIAAVIGVFWALRTLST